MTPFRGWPAPAKLNRFLHILGRRADGYHELQTVFQLLELGDIVDFEPHSSPQVRVSCAGCDIPETANLAWRAAKALQERYARGHGVRIHVSKRIPVSGGLGGGSSDAATVLVALNRLWNLHLDVDALAALGLTIGADVPLFVRGWSAWGEGIGERLTPLELEPEWFVIIDPGEAVSTATVFADPELTRHTPRMRMRERSAGEARNDCESVVRARHPRIAAALDWLGARGAARLTGSGGCLFAPFPSEAVARAVADTVPPPWRGVVACGCNESPLRRFARGGD